MVGPSLFDEDRTLANARPKLGRVPLVAAPAGLVALQVGGSPLQLGAAVGAGLALGLALLAFLLRLGREFRRSS